jgi:capsular polysaccharide biosynthesis protein
MNQLQNNPSQQEIVVSDFNDDEIDILGLIQTLGEEKWLLFGLPFLCACIAAVVSFQITPIYTAKATFIVPDKQTNSASAALDQLGGLGGLVGSLSKSPTEMYVALMRSNAVLDVIIEELGLKQRYQIITQEDARKRLLGLVKIDTDKKTNMLTIEAQDQSPEFAAKIANAFFKPFSALLRRMSIEEAHVRRDFFARQIEVIAQRPFRDPFIQSSLMNTMIKQFEAARIDEARDSQILFSVDIAKSPERKSSPQRLRLVLVVGSAAFFLAFLLILFKKVLLRFKNDSASSQKWVMMKKAWKLRS